MPDEPVDGEGGGNPVRYGEGDAGDFVGDVGSPNVVFVGPALGGLPYSGSYTDGARL